MSRPAAPKSLKDFKNIGMELIGQGQLTPAEEFEESLYAKGMPASDRYDMASEEISLKSPTLIGDRLECATNVILEQANRRQYVHYCMRHALDSAKKSGRILTQKERASLELEAQKNAIEKVGRERNGQLEERQSTKSLEDQMLMAEAEANYYCKQTSTHVSLLKNKIIAKAGAGGKKQTKEEKQRDLAERLGEEFFKQHRKPNMNYPQLLALRDKFAKHVGPRIAEIFRANDNVNSLLEDIDKKSQQLDKARMAFTNSIKPDVISENKDKINEIRAEKDRIDSELKSIAGQISSEKVQRIKDSLDDLTREEEALKKETKKLALQFDQAKEKLIDAQNGLAATTSELQKAYAKRQSLIPPKVQEGKTSALHKLNADIKAEAKYLEEKVQGLIRPKGIKKVMSKFQQPKKGGLGH